MTCAADRLPDRLPDALLDHLLAQDVPHGDLTTEALGIGALPGRITFAARRDMVLCCGEEAAWLLSRAGATAGPATPSGTAVAAGEIFLAAEGPAAALHRAWKVAQTLVEYASGIATRARAIVEAAAGIPIACTRKNFPGTKEISVRAVRAGGARMHRLGLSETLLVFPEHLAFINPADRDALTRIKRREPERKLVVEVGSLEAALAAARAGADVIQLEKFAPEAVRATVTALQEARLAPLVLAAGGIDAGNAAAYAATGCAMLVTSAPYFGPPADVKVVVVPQA